MWTTFVMGALTTLLGVLSLGYAWVQWSAFCRLGQFCDPCENGASGTTGTDGHRARALLRFARGQFRRRSLIGVALGLSGGGMVAATYYIERNPVVGAGLWMLVLTAFLLIIILGIADAVAVWGSRLQMEQERSTRETLRLLREAQRREGLASKLDPHPEQDSK